MNHNDLQKYCEKAVQHGFTHAKPVDPATVVTASWVRLKCQFGCPGYGLSHCCPPNTPPPDETRRVLDAYRHAILFHLEAPKTPDRGKQAQKMMEILIDLEGEIFKDGYYKAFAYVAGPCGLCKECTKIKGTPCNFGHKARPSMESCGMDVYQTARNNGFPIQTLKEKTETRNIYGLMLVE
jgi:predicted metal-binding protein